MIELKTAQEIQCMRRAGRIVAQVLQHLARMVRPGLTTADLDREAERVRQPFGGEPAFKGYRGFPATLCTSVNDEVVHGVPGNRILREGDIIGLDYGVRLDGFYADAAVTVPLGRIPPATERLLRVTEEALRRGIAEVRVGQRLSNVSAAIQQHVEGEGLSVVRQFVGHGIGRALHEDPPIPNFGEPDRGPRLKVGMVLAIEPMVNLGSAEVELLNDGWTVITTDRQLSAHFEHTVAVTEHGADVLTALTSGVEARVERRGD